MRSGWSTLLLIIVPGLPALPTPADAGDRSKATAAAFSEDIAPFLKRFCTDCHGGTKPKAGLNLARFDGEESVLRGRKVWARVKEYVEAGEMPPEGKPQPGQEAIDRFTGWVTTTLAKVDCSSQS